jgi:tetratricopeptide (TPR) repeat protein
MPGYRQVFEQAMKRGHGFARQRAWDKAAVEFQRALAEYPDDQVALAAASLALINAKRWAEALTVVEHAHQVFPEDTATLEQLANVQEQLGNLPAAAQSRSQLGELYTRQDKADQAIAQWTRASQYDPDNLDYHHKLAATYQKQNKPKQAVAELLILVRLYRKNGDIDQAALQCRTAISLDPRNTDALKLMGEIRVERGTGSLPTLPEPSPAPTSTTTPALPSPAALAPETSEAAALASDASSTPVDMTLQRALSDLAEFIFEDQVSFQPRADARGSAARLTKSELNTLVGQAIDLQTRERDAEVVPTYRRILEAVELPGARFNLGLIYERQLCFDDAIEQFQLSLHNPEYALGSHFALGECCRAKGQTDEALKHFIQVLKLVDLATVRRDQTDELGALYDRLANTYLEGEPDRAQQFADSIIEFLSNKGWDARVVEARERLNTMSTEGAPLISLAEMLTVPNVEAVLQSLALMHEYTRNRKIYTALEEAYAAIGYASGYLPLHRRIGDILWEGGLQEAAIAKYQTIANTYQARGDYLQAVTALQRILNLMPTDMDTRSKLIQLHLDHEDTDRALEQYMALAETYDQMAELDKTREKYQEAMKYVPRASDSKRWAAKILYRVGDLDMQRIDWRRAIQDYEQIKAIVPEEEKARLQLVELRFKTNDNARAIKELDELLVMYSTGGQANKIIPALEEHIRNHPNEMGLRMRLGRAYLGAGLTMQAVEQLDALADLQLQAGLTKEAIATIKGIVTLNPPNIADYRQALAQLGSS